MNYYRYDTHVHTSEVSPCGKLRADEVVSLYKEAGYAGIIITDHYYDSIIENPERSWEEAAEHYLSGYGKAAEEGEKAGLDVLLGMEIRFNGTNEDFLVYGIDEEFVMEHPYLNRNTLASFRELVSGKDILIFQAHPFRKKLTPAPPELLDGVEAFNGNPRHNSNNDQAFQYGLTHRLHLSSGSDAHQAVDVGRGGIGVTERLQSVHDFVSWVQSDKPMDLIHKAK